jgi:hypothetical protein
MSSCWPMSSCSILLQDNIFAAAKFRGNAR